MVDPRKLLEALTCRASRAVAAEPVDGKERFHRYLDTFVEPGGDRQRRYYPGLASQPWHDPADFPLARYLEANYEAISAEILAMDSASFRPESEPIGRSGSWDVIFFYERGQRHEANCAACPVTVRGIETHPSMRTVAGLSYVSRLRGETHIAPHSGPTNMRVRCHLAILVPEGDCAIRVGSETRNWHEGRCLVFDDRFEHEAWNHTGHDRIILVVDLWHPGLSVVEVGLLEGLHTYAYACARQLNGYWKKNAAASSEVPAPGGPPEKISQRTKRLTTQLRERLRN